MGEVTSKPQAIRKTVSAMMDIDQIESVDSFNGSTGCIDFTIADDSGLSQNRIRRVVPDGWMNTLVVTPGSSNSVYISRE